MILRKLVGWPLCQAFYYLGDWSSRLVNYCPSADEEEPGPVCMALVYLYQVFMIRSYRLNEWAGLRVWYPPDEGGPDWRT